ncbi:TIGR03084 family protein [Actinosynnema pretiosum subsp. pretiosum]|uniref:TIGR03084 family protein n=1 Tax=Actinosynnema pretiosum subsp. pretiosum TaxID=103721 RepID=A0AA45LBP4_9PSEU|nr:TIGR03084 family protein [Actinosynnema pretiosum subsp. pretiosum]
MSGTVDPVLGAVLRDLAAEGRELEGLVAEADWGAPTPAPGWTIGHQVRHLHWTDRAVLLALLDPDQFRAMAAAVASDVTGAVERGACTPVTLEGWRDGRRRLSSALAGARGRVPWFGPPMSPTTMATARVMETWAHGQDVADALGVVRTPTARLRHVAHIGVRAFGFAFTANGLPVPPVSPRVELVAPDGGLWTWGDEGAEDRITGRALDFCLLVTRRRHPADLAVRATGTAASAWLPIAQAFAGPPGAGRAPGGNGVISGETGSRWSRDRGARNGPGFGGTPGIGGDRGARNGRGPHGSGDRDPGAHDGLSAPGSRADPVDRTDRAGGGHR